MAISGANVVEAAGVERRFGGVAALAGADLRVAAGEVIALLGHNGAGKTTLLRVLALSLRPTGGTLRLFGDDVHSRPATALRRIGYVGHETACYPDLSGEENLQFYARLFGLADPTPRIAELLVWTRLGRAARRTARTYSRGMLQRLALARALLHRPDLVLLDEPFTGLDPDGTAQLGETLRALGRAGHAVVFSTHDLPTAAAVASRAVVLRGGRVTWSGAPVEAVVGTRSDA